MRRGGKMAKKTGTEKIKTDNFDTLARENEEHFNKLMAIRQLIVSYEYSGGMYIPTQEIRKVIGWESGKDYRTAGSGS